MRLILYNIRYGAGAGRGPLKRRARVLESVAEFLRMQDPDLVGLLEVDSGSIWSHGVNQAEELARQLGHYHVYQCKYAEHWRMPWFPWVKRQCNAFLTREEIRAQRFHYFERGFKRLVIELELDDLVLFLVHLSLRPRVRRHQIENLVPLVRSTTKPRIVAGDFNTFSGERELQPLLEATGLRNAATGPALSHPSWAPRRALDHILHTPDIRVVRFYIPQVRFSDHLPLVCDFELPAASSF